MAITAVNTTNHDDFTEKSLLYYGSLALTGTYTTGGFAYNVIQNSRKGSSIPSRTVLSMVFTSPLGYTYYYNAATQKIQIFTAPNTELGNGAAPPEATVNYMATLRKFN